MKHVLDKFSLRSYSRRTEVEKSVFNAQSVPVTLRNCLNKSGRCALRFDFAIDQKHYVIAYNFRFTKIVCRENNSARFSHLSQPATYLPFILRIEM